MIIASLYPCPFDPQVRHDLNAAVITDTQIYAYEEDKLTSIKNEPTSHFPERSLMMGLKEFGIVPADVELWVLPTPRERDCADRLFMFFSLIKAYGGSQQNFRKWMDDKIQFVDHHVSHAALAIFGSGFEECAFLSQDGGGDLGDPRNMIAGEFANGVLKITREKSGLDNICSFHAFVTDATGFDGGENGKTSGLAAYGRTREELKSALRSLVTVQDDGIVFRRERYARTQVNLARVKPQEYDRNKIFLRTPSDTNVFRLSAAELSADIAATGESVLQETVLEFLRKFRATTKLDKIVFSGGLFQNVALNNAVLKSGLFSDYHFPMAPSDGGLALGAALYARHLRGDGKHKRSESLPAYLGPSFPTEEVHALLQKFRLRFHRVENPADTAAELIAAGKIVGWFQGRAEYGPRSLGARSILADPRNEASKLRVNQRLKRRDWFMPFAPSILEEFMPEWAVIPHFSPYMQVAFDVAAEKRSIIPAAIHVDGTCRINSVRKSDNPLYWELIDGFRKRTGLPVVLNTSFNRHGIATISSPRQAIEHLLEGCMDILIIDGFLVDFTENRLTSEEDAPAESEDTLLYEDALKRAKVVATHASPEAHAAYLRNLKDQFGDMAQ